MKKLLLLFVTVLAFNLSNAQVKEVVVQAKNGMEDLVDVNFTVMLKSSPITLEELHSNYISSLTEKDIENGFGDTTIDEFLASKVRLMSMYVKMFKVKNEATWIPKKVDMYWSEKNNSVTLQFIGFASNAYGTPGKITSYFVMDENGKVSKDPILF